MVVSLSMHLRAEVANELRVSGLSTGRAALVVASLVVLSETFGKEWCVESGLVKRAVNTIRDGLASARVVRLAEALYNLRSVSGFAKKIELAKSKLDIGEFEAELWPARLIIWAGSSLEFIDPLSVHGKSPDVSVASGLAHAEFKNKLATTEFKYKTILRSLKEAARKPTPGAKLLYLRIPAEWGVHPTLELNIRAAFADVARQNKSVALQVAHFEICEDGFWAVGKYSHRNAECRCRSEALDQLVLQLDAELPPKPSSWVTVEELCEAASGQSP